VDRSDMTTACMDGGDMTTACVATAAVPRRCRQQVTTREEQSC
jgi:hypothetical protein